MYETSKRSTVPTTDRTLVVLDPSDPTTTLRAALRHPDIGDARLSLLVVFPTSEYEARRRARRDAGVTAPYTIEHLETEAAGIARRAGVECLGSPERFEANGAVGRPRDTVRLAVDQLAVGRVFVAAPRRTVWQRLLGAPNLPAELARDLSSMVNVVAIDGTSSTTSDGVDPTAVVEGLEPDLAD